MIHRKIVRTAMLQDYTGLKETLFALLEEVAGKGYHCVSLSAKEENIETVKALCEKAVSCGMGVCLFTFYMKYQYRYLSHHPDQKLVSASDFQNRQGRSTGIWGCPFNPEFKNRQLLFLREVARFPGVERIQINDEAYLPGGACHCETCRGAYLADFGEGMPVVLNPAIEEWKDIKWRRFLEWTIERWNGVHCEMSRAIHEINKNIKVVFQASPSTDLWRNPWSTGVDLSGMAEQLDGLSTDPYYTFHNAPFFSPAETYLSEWCRFLKGAAGDGKLAEIIPQGFSHPTFTRPLGAEDGIWSAVIPPSCGVDIITPFTYSLQKISPVQKTYEGAFKLDRYFEKAVPLKYSALVHGARTEIYKRPLPASTPLSYDGTRVLPVAQSLRHTGIPYGYIPDKGLKDLNNLFSYRVIILPEINCLSQEEEKGIREFVSGKGRMAVLGCMGTDDGTGTKKNNGGSLLQELCGIKVTGETGRQQRFRMVENLPFMKNLYTVDEKIAERYSNGTCKPLFTLDHCVDAEVPGDSRIIAEFLDENGTPSGRPAIVLAGKDGNLLWFAGFPTHVSKNEAYGTTVRNQSHLLFPLLVEWFAGEKPALRVEGWPPEVPMRKLRPLDYRYMSTFEFFPLEGKDIYMGTIASYFKEPASFAMAADIPPGKRIKEVRELLTGKRVPFETSENKAEITVDMGYEDAAKVFLFRFG
ncbi:MAG TPA: hypothetical protein PKN36_07200 [bacterium]|nr:hypothetical protein [bacterium]